MPSKLSSEQIFKQVMDDSAVALRMIPASTTSFSIELDAADGDNVRSIPDSLTVTQAVGPATGVVVPATPSISIKSINVVAQTTSTIVGPQVLTLEYSPSDSANVWVATTLTLTPSTVSGTIVAGTALSNLVARRIRVSTAATITSGAYTLYIVGQAV